MHQVRETLRMWLAGEGIRPTARLVGLDRKTVQRYVAAAEAAGVVRTGGPEQLTDEVIGTVCGVVRPARRDGRGEAWRGLEPVTADITAWVEKGVPLVKVHQLLARRGVVVPYRTLHRFAVANCGFDTRRATVRVADGEPGVECQVDFGRMGLVPDPACGRRRVCWALVFTAVYSRHLYVWLSYRQRVGDVIAGCEAAWAFFGGVFRVLVPDNMAAIVDVADPTNPRINAAFAEYAQSRGFVVDPARVRRPQDKGRVERAVAYVRGSLFAGEEFIDLADAQRRAEAWCREVAATRIHRGTGRRPGEVFAAEEADRLLAGPVMPYDLATYSHPKVHRDGHVEVARALYSVPYHLRGATLDARADSVLVKLFHRGQLVKVHPRQRPGGRHTDPADMPPGKAAYANRDTAWLLAQAGLHGESVGAMATALLDVELPWTKMRQVYRLLGLARRFGSARVDDACAKAIAIDCADVGLVARMLEHGCSPPSPGSIAQTLPLRFARPDEEIGGGR